MSDNKYLLGSEDEWQPLPGMVKLKCERCRHFFASRDPEAMKCPECRAGRPGKGYHANPFDPTDAGRRIAPRGTMKDES